MKHSRLRIAVRSDLVAVDQSSVMGHCPDPKPKKHPWMACSECGHVGNGKLIDYSTGKCRGRVNCAKRRA